MRASTVAAPPAARSACDPPSENRRNSTPSRHAGANAFRKTEYVLFSLLQSNQRPPIRGARMSETEKIIFHDRDVAAVVSAPMLAAILLTLLATASARGAFAVRAFGVAFIMLTVTLRPSRLARPAAA